MKVQGLNSSSAKTRSLIKKTFAELINEKKELNKVTVTELVKRANITRSTFYTHYDDIYDVVNDYQMETIELLIRDDKILNSIQDIYDYFAQIFECLKKNDEIYKMLLSSNASIVFLDELKELANEKIYSALKNIITTNPYLKLDLDFYLDGMFSEIIRYFRGQSNYSPSELYENSKKWFEKLFK